MSVKMANPAMTRRGFMKNAVVAGGVAATVAVTKKVDASTETDSVSVQEPEGKLGYRETPHIREYYQKARF